MTYEFKYLIIAVLRVSVIGMLAFLNMRHLIESFHDVRKNMPKKMVKCDDREVLRDIIKTEPRKFDVLQVSVSEKSINASIQVNLDPAAVSGSIDQEKFQQLMEINLKLENRLTKLEEMIRCGDDKQKIRDLQQLRQLEDFMLSKMTRSAHTQTESELSLSTVQDLNDKVDKLSNYQQSLMEKIDGEFMTIGCDVKNIKNCCGVLNTIFHELENKFISLESNSEKPMRKYSEIKTRIATLERDLMKNTSHVIGMNHSHCSLEWTRLQSFGSAGMFPPDNRCYGEPVAFAATPSSYDMPPMPRPAPGAFLPPPPPAPPAPSAFLPPPPPAPPSTSEFLAPLPQDTPKKPGLLTDSDKSSSSSAVTAKVEKVYGRIPITTEILKSVVLKPPGERKRVSKSVMI